MTTHIITPEGQKAIRKLVRLYKKSNKSKTEFNEFLAYVNKDLHVSSYLLAEELGISRTGVNYLVSTVRGGKQS